MANAVFPTPYLNGLRLHSGEKLNSLFQNPPGSTQTGVTAHAGGTRAPAFPITAKYTNVTTVASGNDSVVLPKATSSLGQEFTIVNNGANSMQVFANGSDTINGTAGATGVAQAAGATDTYYAVASNAWESIGTSSGSFTGAFNGTVGATTPNTGVFTTDTANSLILNGSGSGSTTVNAAATASGVLTLPAATDTLVGKATTDTLTNKTLTSPTLTTPALGVATATSINGVTLTTGTGTVTLGSNTLTLAGNLTTTGAFNTTVAQTATSTLTTAGTNGVIAQTSGANLYIADIYKNTLLTITNSVTPTLIPGLAATVVVGTYRIKAALYCTPAATGGVAVSFVLTTAVLNPVAFIGTSVTAATCAAQATTTATSATNICAVATIPILVQIDGTFTVTTGGTFSLYGCQNTQVNSAATINAGGYMELTRIA